MTKKTFNYSALTSDLSSDQFAKFANKFQDSPLPKNSSEMFATSHRARTEEAFRLMNFSTENNVGYFLKKGRISNYASVDISSDFILSASGSELLNFTRKSVGDSSIAEAVHSSDFAAMKARIINQTKSGKLIVKSTDIFMFKLDKELPQLIVNRVDGIRRLGKLSRYFDKTKVFRGEGLFGKRFEMISPDGYHLDALSFMTPELMEQIMRLSGAYNLEVVGKKLIITPISMKSKFLQIMVDDFDTMRSIAWEVNDNTRNYNVPPTPTIPTVNDRTLHRSSMLIIVIIVTLLGAMMMAALRYLL